MPHLRQTVMLRSSGSPVIDVRHHRPGFGPLKRLATNRAWAATDGSRRRWALCRVTPSAPLAAPFVFPLLPPL
jgi:hypothetical protein